MFLEENMEYKINKINYSKREIEIISCMCNGCSSKIIAGILNISPYTVDSHIKNIKGKMNCFSRNAIVNFVENSEEYSNIRAKYAELKQLQVYSEREAINAYSYVRKKIGISVLIKCAISFMVVLIIGLTVSYWVKQPNLSYEIQLPNEHILLPRKDIIGKIKKIFSSGDKLNFVVLLGEAGIGKTTIARSYIKNSNFSIRAEIDAESEFKIIESFEDLIFLLSKTDEQLKTLQFIKNIDNPEEKRKKLKIFLADLLKGYKNWCIIYDNAEELELLRKWLPLDSNLFSNGNIIITTKNQSIENLVFPYPLNIVNVSHLTEVESEKLFYSIVNKKSKKRDRGLIKLLLKNVSATPLDISSVAYFMKINKMDLREYLKLINKKGIRMDSITKNKLGDYNKTRETIISTTFDKILDRSKENFKLLLMMCLLDSESIKEEYFKFVASEERVKEFLEELKKYSILRDDKGYFSIHRLNQELGLLYLIRRFSKTKIDKSLADIIDSIAAFNKIEWKWSKSVEKLEKEKSRLLIPHLESILNKLDSYRDLENYNNYRLKILMALYFAYNGESSYKESYKRGKELIELNSKEKIIRGKDLALLLLQHVYVSIYCGETSDIAKNAEECLKICEGIENTDHFKIGARLYLSRYYFDFNPDYEKAKKLLRESLELKDSISEKDWDIVMCVFANQIYRGYEAYYTNDKNKIKEAIGYLKQALKEKGFCESYRKTGVKKVSLDKTVFLMYVIEMMINISRGYNVIEEFDKALENELDIAYIYDLLNKQGICFYSQEFHLRDHPENCVNRK